MATRAYIGTSGWVYKSWKEAWYDGAPSADWLRITAERFCAVEVDGTFYRLQKRETFESWASQTPRDFRFAIRGSRFTTHNKKLLDAPDSMLRQREPAEGLGSKLAVVLWQFPPRWRLNLERLEQFAEALKSCWPNVRHTIEVRHESWMVDEVASLLQRHRLANCISDAGNFKRWDVVTTDLVYVRLHGKPHTYASNYSERELDEWAEKVARWTGEGREVHVYFDNDIEGHAPRNAQSLLGRLGGRNGACSD